MQSVRFLTVTEVIHMHSVQIIQFGGIHGIRDLALLESAVYTPQAGFANEYFHKDISKMTAAYLYHIVKNHPFIDGNKRTGLLASLSFLDMNGVEITWTNSAMYHITMQVAASQITKEDLVNFFRKID